MSDQPDTSDDPAVVGVPAETPDEIRPSATGVVAGPVDGETDVEVADVHVGEAARGGEEADDQVLEDAEGGIEGSLLDAPDEPGIAPI